MKHSASFLRSHRKRSGMYLREVARIVGYGHGGEVSRHEKLMSIPSLRTALRYEALYHVPIKELFPGLFEEVKREVEERLDALLEECGQSSALGRKGAQIARKLEWACERGNPQTNLPFDTP